jgi:hypothetical protein
MIYGENRQPFRRNTSLESSEPESGLLFSSTAEGLEFESQWGQECSLLHIFHTGCGDHPPVTGGGGAHSPEITLTERQAEH